MEEIAVSVVNLATKVMDVVNAPAAVGEWATHVCVELEPRLHLELVFNADQTRC